MAYKNFKMYVHVLFILIQIFNISSEKQIPKAKMSLDTDYPVHVFTLNWSIAEYSQINDTVVAEFPIAHISMWKVSLFDKKYIILEKRDLGEESVRIKSNCSSIAQYKTFHKQRMEVCNRNSTLYKLQVLALEENTERAQTETPIEFEGDILKVHCTIEVRGPSRTKRAIKFEEPIVGYNYK